MVGHCVRRVGVGGASEVSYKAPLQWGCENDKCGRTVAPQGTRDAVN